MFANDGTLGRPYWLFDERFRVRSHRSNSPWLRTILFGLLVAGVLGYAVFLWRQVSPFAGGADSSGYLNSARLFGEGRMFASPRVLPDLSTAGFGANAYVPLGFALRGDGNLVPIYPVRYPLQLLVSAGFGWSRAVQPMSDLSALGWALVVLYTAFRLRERWPWALLCGAAVGIAVLVRPTNILLLVPVLVATGFCFRLWLMVGLDGLPGAVFLGHHNCSSLVRL